MRKLIIVSTIVLILAVSATLIVVYVVFTGQPEQFSQNVIASTNNKLLHLQQSTLVVTCGSCESYTKEEIPLSLFPDLFYLQLTDTKTDIGVHQDVLRSIISSISEKIQSSTTITIENTPIPATTHFFDFTRSVQDLSDVFLQGSEDSIYTVAIEPYIIHDPITNGMYADTYIEIDISTQTLYTWNDGNLVKSYTISTGREGDNTPEGIFRIKNKYDNTFSPIAKMWTPYWMAFTYDWDNEAWLGFHERPYLIGQNGQKIRRSEDTMGKLVTGGCIQLDVGDAKELYDWTQIEIPVLIHE